MSYINIYMIFLRESNIVFNCCELSLMLPPVVQLNTEIGFHRGRTRVGFVEERHEGAVHPGPLRGAGARAHDDADGYKQDRHADGAQYH